MAAAAFAPLFGCSLVAGIDHLSKVACTTTCIDETPAPDASSGDPSVAAEDGSIDENDAPSLDAPPCTVAPYKVVPAESAAMPL